jgi:hypothetical protein
MVKKIILGAIAMAIMAVIALLVFYGVRVIWPLLLLLVVIDFIFERKWIPNQYRAGTYIVILVAAWVLILWDCTRSFF